jgi:DNA polymerase-3 subunit beta
MRCVVNTKALAPGLKFAAQAIPNRTTIPIVGNIKIEANGTSLTITGTDLDQQHLASVDGLDLAEPGAATVPGGRFASLIAKLPPAADVTIRTEADQCLVSSGGGRWKLPTLLAEDFPVLTPPGADAAVFMLAQAEAQRLVRRLEHAISVEDTRYYLNGVHLHRQDGKLVGAATNGHLLVRIVIDLDPGQDLKVIVPAKVIGILNELAAHGDVEVLVDQNKISLRSGSWTIVSKLIDGIFPDYARILPGKIKNNIEVPTADLIASIARHKAAAELDTAIGLTWQNGTLTTCLSRNEDDAVEEIDGLSSSGTGRVAASANYLLDTLKALDAKTVVIEHQNSGEPIRITTAAEPESVTIVMPMQWLTPVVVEQPAPPTRNRRGK